MQGRQTHARVRVRQQQVGEAWFADISQVPKQALSMSVRQVLKAQEILAVVPDARKAGKSWTFDRGTFDRWRQRPQIG